MRLDRPVTRIVLSPSERETLERYTRRPATAQALALRAGIVLRCAAGETHTAIAADLHGTKQTVGKWRRRFVDARVPGLLDEPRPGAPRKISDAALERVLTTTRAHLEGLRAATAPDRDLQTVEGPARSVP